MVLPVFAFLHSFCYLLPSAPSSPGCKKPGQGERDQSDASQQHLKQDLHTGPCKSAATTCWNGCCLPRPILAVLNPQSLFHPTHLCQQAEVPRRSLRGPSHSTDSMFPPGCRSPVCSQWTQKYKPEASCLCGTVISTIILLVLSLLL